MKTLLYNSKTIITVAFMAVCAISSLMLAEASEPTNPENLNSSIKWGLSKEAVKKLYGYKPDDELDNIIFYEGTLGKDNVTKLYMFDLKGRLFSILNVFKIVQNDEDAYRKKFSTVYANVSSKYGDSDLYENHPLNSKGIIAAWHNNESRITLRCQIKKPFNKLVLALQYLDISSPNAKHFFDEIESQY